MDTQSTERNEENLIAMLSSLRKEALYDNNFEETFLQNFQLRKEAHQATQSTWKLLLERLDNYLQNFHSWQWIYASMSIVTLAAVGVIIASGDPNSTDSYVSTPNTGEEAIKGAVPVSENTVMEIPTSDPSLRTTTFTTEAPSNDKSTQHPQSEQSNNTEDKPVSRVLIEM